MGSENPSPPMIGAGRLQSTSITHSATGVDEGKASRQHSDGPSPTLITELPSLTKPNDKTIGQQLLGHGTADVPHTAGAAPLRRINDACDEPTTSSDNNNISTMIAQRDMELSSLGKEMNRYNTGNAATAASTSASATTTANINNAAAICAHDSIITPQKSMHPHSHPHSPAAAVY